MRQNKTFPPVPPQPQPEPQPPPSRLGVTRLRLGGFFTRFRNLFFLGAGVLIVLASLFVYDATRPPPQNLTQDDIDAAVERALATIPPPPSFASQVYEIIHPSLVRINVRLPGTGGKTENGLGTGIVISDRGIILTSLHVVKDAVEVRVVFADGSESEALVIVRQPEKDLAVLRPLIIPDDLVPATLGNSATLRVGDEVVAVGNPFGITNSLSSGVVSGLGRNFRSPKTGETLTDMIQFDAAVNPGNSGGPLVNRNGEVVGIVTGLLNPTEQDVFVGLGFAVPIETAAAAGGAPPL